MKPCSEYHEKMMLDVYGELNSADRKEWDEHVVTCDGCRTERDRLHHLIHQIQETLPCRDLTREEAGELATSIKARLQKKRTEFWWQKKLFGFPARLVPALGCAMLLILAMGWFGLNDIEEPISLQSATNLTQVEKMMIKDFEIIRNIEILEEMEAIQKLVKVVDGRDV